MNSPSAPPEEQKRQADIRNVIDRLEQSVDMMAEQIGKPRWIDDDPERLRFRYDNPTPRILQVCKSVRVVSGLHSASVLLYFGRTTEMAVVLRTVDDFIDEIMFVEEALESGAPTTDPQRFIDHFFADETHTTDELLANPPRSSNVPRKSIVAAQGRFLQPGNPHRIMKVFKAVDSVYSGVVHGTYQSIMEMYVGGTYKYEMEGLFHRVPGMRGELARYTHRAINTIGGVAYGLGLGQLSAELRDVRLKFEGTNPETVDGSAS